MKEVLKTLVTWGIRCGLRIFWLFPIRRRQVFFSAYSGNQYACNPKYISEALAARYSQKLQLIWCWKDTDFPDKPHGVRFVKFRSLRYFKELLTSRVVVLNDLQHCSYLPFRKNQMLIQTWHGGGLYKKVGRDTPNNTVWNDRRLARTIKDTTLFLSSSTAFSDTVVRGAFGFDGEIREIGMPRNDILLNADRAADAAKRVRSAYGFSENQRLLLYAPTFRENGTACPQTLDADRLLAACQARFGGDWKLLVRSHYLLAHSDLLCSPQCVDATAYPDMQELLCAADVLVSDYSSCIWDFSLTGKPCFIFAPDLDAYRFDRDFYMDIVQ